MSIRIRECIPASPSCSTMGNTIPQHLYLIQQCLESQSLNLTQLLHSRLIKTALILNTLLANRLLDLYARSGCIASADKAFALLQHKNHHSWNTLLAAHARSGHTHTARNLFDEMPDRNLVAYNTMISSLTRQGHHKDALHFFRRMRTHSNSLCITMDKFTVVGAATACGALGDVRPLRQLHSAVIAAGLEVNLIMSNVLVDAYGKCGNPDVARLVFDRMEERDVVTWTSLVVGYARAGRMEEALQVFHLMPVRNGVAWTALISGHEQNGQEEVALRLFEEMMEEGVVPSPYTFVSVLSACGRMGFIARGKQLHGYIVRRGAGYDSSYVFMYNALIDLYAKCGDINSATVLFDRMQMRDVVSWNSVITGFAQNGNGKQALALFEKMIEAGVAPTDVTFLGVLSACSHTGMVSEGRRFLDSMEKEYGVSPRPDHYAAFIDTLGRKHQLVEAMQFIESMPSTGGSSASVGTWGALLGACQVHGDLEIAKKAAHSLFELDPESGGRYVTLSNIYAAAGRWDDARRFMLLMKRKGLKKEHGCSWIEVKSVKHMFFVQDQFHSQAEEIYEMIETLHEQMVEIDRMEEHDQQAE